MPNDSPSGFKTGIAGLDFLLGGGFRRHRLSVVVTGEPGCGKTVLAAQTCFVQAAQGHPVVFATVTSESHDRLIEALGSFSFFDPSRLGNEMFLLNAYAWMKKGAKDTRDILLKTVRDRRAKLLVIDGMRSVRDLWQDEAALREFLYELAVGLATVDCMLLFTTEYPLSRLLELPEATTVDAVVSISTEDIGSTAVRRIQIVKVRGQEHMTGRHVMQICPTGITIYPRIEATAPPPVSVSELGRAEFGHSEFDRLLHGGLPTRSATLLAGTAGIGKSTLALYFAAAGAAKGEPSLFFSLTEQPHDLIERARRIGLDVAPLVNQGALRVEYHRAVEVEADVLADHLLSVVTAMGARRLVFDDIDSFEQMFAHPTRFAGFLTALAVRLRAAGVTTIFTKRIVKMVGLELDFATTPLAALTENLILMRIVELEGRLHRVLSVLAVRDSSFEDDLREFVISDKGVEVLPPIRSAEGLLTGRARPVGSRTPLDDEP